MVRHQQKERGQAAVEFVFSLVIIIAFTAVLFQALHFERDVFDKTGNLRYRALARARENQDSTEPETVTDIKATGKDLGNLTFFTVPLQEVDLSQHYGPKRLVIRHGTRYWDPTPIHAEWAFAAATIPDHYEDTAGYIGKLFGYVWDVIGHVPL